MTEKPEATPKRKKYYQRQKQQLSKLKLKFLEYFREVPVQKLAAAYIGRDETRIVSWKNHDTNFANQIEEAKANWARDKVKGVKSEEWLLERLMKDHFAERKEFEHGVSEELEAILNRVDKILPK